MGVSENRGTLFGVLIIRILLFRVLYWDPLFFGNSHIKAEALTSNTNYGTRKFH